MPKLIVGLGNPGKDYEKTRHNAGFLAIDVLLQKYGFDKEENNFQGILYTKKIQNEKVFFLKPQTFMNLSGQSVVKLMNFYKINIEDIVILYDDKDLPIGKVSFRAKGSSGGQKGIQNIITLLGTDIFKRIRIGIGNPPPGYQIVSWVLSKLSNDELNTLSESVKKVENFVDDFASALEYEKIMTKYNKEK